MKILLVTPHFPPEVGGIEYHVFNLARGLSKRHRVTVVTCGCNNGEEEHNGFEVARLPFIVPPPHPYETLSSWKIPYLSSWFSWFHSLDDFDIIHIHGHHYPISWIAACSNTNTPRVLTLHGLYALNSKNPGGKSFFEEIFNKTMFRFMLQKIDAIIGLTPTILAYAMKYSSRAVRFYTIPNGVDLGLYSKSLGNKMNYREKYGIPDDKIVVLFSGRFSRAKGVMELATAIKEILRIRRDVFFLLVGGGQFEDNIKAMLDGLENVSFMGWVPNENIHELEVAADILVMPSKWEALPITLIEGMAAQLHLVTTQVGGIADILNKYNNKTYIKGFTASSVRSALSEALETFNARKLDSSDTWYTEQFDWNRILKRIETVYNEIA